VKELKNRGEKATKSNGERENRNLPQKAETSSLLAESLDERKIQFQSSAGGIMNDQRRSATRNTIGLM
jgi:hypothetical protein